MNDSLALTTHGLTKAYGPIQALRGVDLEVRRGEILASSGQTVRARPPRSVACLI